ncbi:MAG: DUF2145 domain-containing protein [Pseudomonadota bacterium]
MKSMILTLRTLCFICVVWAGNANAGRSCEESATNPHSVMRGLELAQKTMKALDASGGEVALIARVGQDLSKYNLRYSHIGFVWRDHPEGRWTVMHELNQCGTANSDLFNEGLGNFFMDDPFAYETLILVPGSAMQQKIVASLNSPAVNQMHSAHYNMLSYVFSTTYQNSNQWVLEMLAAASASDVKINDRTQAQTWLKMAGFKPITLTISTATRLGARMFRANVAFDDHPFDRRMAGQIDTVTVDSIVRFVESRDPEVKKIVLKLD